MNGILVVDKPEGFTSFDVVAKLRGICGTRKIGHGGTLDPMATGVLPVFVGPAVKAVDMAPRQDKTYKAQVLFGLATDTGDITGKVLRREQGVVDAAQLAAVLPRFVGPQQQTPPMYSAVKVDGRPLYSYARAGKQVERKARPVTIHVLELLGGAGENRFDLKVHCSKGTYVRTLMEDIGEALDAPATLAALRRTQAGAFDLAQAHPLKRIQKAKDTGGLSELVLPVEVVFEDLSRCQVEEAGLKRMLNGAPVYGCQLEPGRYTAWCGGAFVGIAEAREDGTLWAEKLFLARE